MWIFDLWVNCCFLRESRLSRDSRDGSWTWLCGDLEFSETLIKSQKLIFLQLEGGYKNEFPGTVPLSHPWMPPLPGTAGKRLQGCDCGHWGQEASCAFGTEIPLAGAGDRRVGSFTLGTTSGTNEHRGKSEMRKGWSLTPGFPHHLTLFHKQVFFLIPDQKQVWLYLCRELYYQFWPQKAILKNGSFQKYLN